MKLVDNKLRVIHLPQIPCDNPYVHLVENEREAYLTYQIMSRQHLFLFDNRYIPDYSNLILVEMEVNGEWEDYYNNNEHLNWDEFIQEYEEYVTTGKF